MSQKLVTPSTSYPSPLLSWSEAWTTAFKGDFDGLIRMSDASIGRAATWISVSTFVGTSARLILGYVFDPGSSILTFVPDLAIFIILGGPVLAVLWLMLTAGLVQLIACILGGTGTYAELVYAFAAYFAPMTIISNVLAPIPLINCLTIPLGLYGFVLHIRAIKVVHHFEWGKAVVSSVSLLILVAVIVMAILLVVGPVVGQVFSNIVENLSTPMP